MPRLPDEIVNEILKPALLVSDEVFCDTGPTAFNFRSEISTSTILLVCKQWLRVATPLLFEVVILRSTGQAKALARVLKTNMQFGQFVRRLRIEGGFGMVVQSIIAAVPKTKDLYLTLSIRSNDNVQGLCKSLPSLNPCRLVIHETLNVARALSNSQTKTLMNTLEGCIKTKWTNLTICQIPYCSDSYQGFPARRAQALADILRHAPSLDTIIVSPYKQLLHSHTTFLESFAHNPGLRRIKILATYAEAEIEGLSKFLDRMPKTAKLIQFLEPVPEPIQTHHFTRSYVCVASASKVVRDEIWSRILEFSMEVDVLHTFKSGAYPKQQFRDLLQEHIKFLSICRQIYECARPQLYRVVVILSFKQLKSLHVLLSGHPDRASNIQQMYFVQYEFARMLDKYGDSYQEEQQMIVDILSLAPNLRHLGILHESRAPTRTLSLQWSGFEALCQNLGSSLQTLHGLEVLNNDDTAKSFSIISDMKTIRSLEWKSRAKLSLDGLSAICLSSLEELILREHDATLTEALATLQLPSLTRIALLENWVYLAPPASLLTFFNVHGSKLRRVELRCNRGVIPLMLSSCPNLVELVLETPETGSFSTSDMLLHLRTGVSNTLRKITIRCGRYDYIRQCCKTLTTSGEGVTEVIKRWGPFLNSPDLASDLSSLPAMREIQFTLTIWPVNQQAYAKSPWIKWASELKEWNIDLTDEAGKGCPARIK